MEHLTEPRLEEIFRYVFKLPQDADVTVVEQGEAPEWDSLAHVSLVLALESEFGIQIEPSESLDLTSFDAVSRFLQERGL
jgi:acyl carrier protein